MSGKLFKQPEDLSKTRVEIFESSKFVADNQKYGLFSFPGTLAVSKTPYFQSTPSKRSPDGTVITAPLNFSAGKRKCGRTPDSYFSVPESLPERYSPLVPSFQSEKDRVKTLKKFHDSSWKHPGSIAELPVLFEHKPTEVFKKINRRDKDGSVRIEPKNIVTSPPKKGFNTPGVTFGKYPEFISDPYERRKQSERKTFGAAEHDGPFKASGYSGRLFNKDSDIYGGEVAKRKNRRTVSYSNTWVKHDLPFKSTCVGKGALGEYPEHIADPLLSPQRKPPSDKIPWRATVSHRSTPTPSVSKNAFNLRREFPSLKNI